MHRQPMKLTGKTYGKITDINHFLNLTETLSVALAHLIGYQSAKRFLVAPQRFTDLTHNFSAFGSRPSSPFAKSVRRGCNHLAIGWFVRHLHRSDQLSVSRR